MARTYILKRQTPTIDADTVSVEKVGNALKRIPTPGVPVNQCRPYFGGKPQKGRTKPEGWSHCIRGTVRELLERHRESWKGIIHITLPTGIEGAQATLIVTRLQRWLSTHDITALGIAETPNPHFHIAVSVPHSQHLESLLRALMRKWWNEILHSVPATGALMWKSQEQSQDAIVRYLSKSSKGGRGVKGKAPWLTFCPYFKTRLPKLPREKMELSKDEAAAVLTDYNLTFGAASRLETLRQTEHVTQSPDLQNPSANATSVVLATHTGGNPISELRGLSPENLDGGTVHEVYGLTRALPNQLLSLRLDMGGFEIARQMHVAGELRLICASSSGSILHMLLADCSSLPPHLRIRLQSGTAVPRNLEVIYLTS